MADVSVESRYSDEPARLDAIVAKVFANPVAGFTAALDNGASVRLLEGAEAQDDCAVFRCAGDHELVIGSDYVRGAKFRLYEAGFLDEYDLGYYLAAANFSDVAAMGARPIGLLTVVRYPPEMSDAVFASVLRGIREACDAFGAPNVGGDIGGAERLILSGTAIGVCLPGRALLRRGARPGDCLCLTGATGIAGAAMAYLRSGKKSPAIEKDHKNALLRSWKRPQARVLEGWHLGQSGLVTSCQDTSDGLKAAIESVARASKVGFQVDEHNLPVREEVSAVCDHLDLDPMAVIMGDSVDFELVFTVPERDLDELNAVFTASGLTFTPIGRATSDGSVTLHGVAGEVRPLPGKAWRHTPEPGS
jgi:thiamine-monophosphate kinase